MENANIKVRFDPSCDPPTAGLQEIHVPNIVGVPSQGDSFICIDSDDTEYEYAVKSVVWKYQAQGSWLAVEIILGEKL